MYPGGSQQASNTSSFLQQIKITGQGSRDCVLLSGIKVHYLLKEISVANPHIFFSFVLGCLSKSSCFSNPVNF